MCGATSARQQRAQAKLQLELGSPRQLLHGRLRCVALQVAHRPQQLLQRAGKRCAQRGRRASAARYCTPGRRASGVPAARLAVSRCTVLPRRQPQRLGCLLLLLLAPSRSHLLQLLLGSQGSTQGHGPVDGRIAPRAPAGQARLVLLLRAADLVRLSRRWRALSPPRPRRRLRRRHIIVSARPAWTRLAPGLAAGASAALLRLPSQLHRRSRCKQLHGF
mmetsp:Transcript_2358/g.6257  ORF Transcript_2358/g.6257 Transcript_2358/m.6257 type:complete len:219 (-) Transcript_2358:282-938(-)